MARPKKNNAEYFTHDADMRNDVRIKALRRKFKHAGYAVWCFLLEALTDSDFFELEWSEINIELFSADFDISSEELQEIVDYCVKIELLQLQDGKLYSNTHKNRFNSLISKRERDRVFVSKQAETGGEKPPKTQEKIVIAAENPESDNDNPAVKESRVKESREENILYPYQDIVELWNSTCTNHSKVLKLTDARKNKIRIRMEEFGKTTEEQLSVVKKLFEKAQASKFMRGDNKTGWRASFDWLFENPKNWVKVLEGNYDNEKPTAGKTGENQAGTGERNYDEQF